MTKEKIASVQIEFSRTPGGPPVTVEDVFNWVDQMLNGDTQPIGSNGMRYSTPKITVITLHDGDGMRRHSTISG